MDKNGNAIIVTYNDNFADNLSLWAYSNILENVTNRKCFYENKTEKRQHLEKQMSNLDIDYKYISTKKVQDIVKLSFDKTKLYIKPNEIKKKKHFKKSILDLKHFRIEDYDLITDEIKNKLQFKSLDFIQNYDILEKINNSNSIGLYINELDVLNSDDIDYINNAVKRLNKYIKSPILFIFSNKILDLNIDIKTKYINLDNYQEEFYFLKMCKHKIILNNKNSYSESFWASVLNEKTYYYNTYKKDKNIKFKKHNWIAI